MTIDGVDVIDPDKLRHPFAGLADTPDEWRGIFGKSLNSIRAFLAMHDGLEVLAKCTNQVMASAAYKKENPHWPVGTYEPYELIEPAELEIIQGLVLMQVSPQEYSCFACQHVPILVRSPEMRLRVLADATQRYIDNLEREHLLGKIRIHTMFHRNLFVKEDCEAVVRSIFRQIDHLTVKELGFAFSEMFLALTTLAADIERRLNEYLDRCREGSLATSEADARRSIDFFCAISPVAMRAWAKCKRHCTTLDDFRGGSFQLSELCHAWPYMLDKAELRSAFGEAAVTFFERISLRMEELASANPEHIFMNNPVWRQPFVALDERTLFLPLPNLFYGFPFQILEQFLAARPSLERAYSVGRARFLEDTIKTHISSGMPSARTYQKVMWRDDVTATLYENDVLALIGNTIFLFEAKSGKLDDVARRGGELRA
jgi:hypothetical protein